MMKSLFNGYEIEGYELLHEFYDPGDISGFIAALERKGVFRYQFADADSHNLFKSIDEVKQLAESEKLLSIAQHILGKRARPFYAILLDKTGSNNWELDWHQDLKIAVRGKIETAGYTDWSLQAGIWHVNPPHYILEQMLSIRVHLDDCDHSNGALWVIPGSQNLGIVNARDIANVVGTGTVLDCEVKSGGIMLMSPLLLHKSPPSKSDSPRRVLQIEYRSAELDGGLEWFN